ncbi:unnamed protein product [Ranitomeya imitator]|uniref:Carbonic anhydrase n=1 Tax=Ranitomeya imitator TaxID=111125 RepID=A0ABN9LAW9_9NEOB|nr:unnamed protein product [Ranitomeya imitator]
MATRGCRRLLAQLLAPGWTGRTPRPSSPCPVPSRACNISACSYKLRNVDLHPLWKGPLDISRGIPPVPYLDIRVRDSVFHPGISRLSLRSMIPTRVFTFGTMDIRLPVVSGGPLENPFRLKQFHFHWGADNNWGSEHTVDSKVFPAELHLVHWNCTRYRDVRGGHHGGQRLGGYRHIPKGNDPSSVQGKRLFLTSSHGDADVLSPQLGRHNEKLQKLVDILPSVRYKDALTEFNYFDPSCLLPTCSDYWTYSGSLTTPRR